MLLNDESIKQMIQKQGLLLKFQHQFKLLTANKLVEEDSGNGGEEICQLSVAREIKKPKVETVVPTGALSVDIIREKSKIYGKDKNTSLSSWHQAVNQAAFIIAQKSPDRMYDGGQLKLDAEEEARKTYVFKKSYGSRSKFDPEKKLAKWPKLSNESRHEEVGICSLELHTVVERARETQKELTRAVAIKDFSKCTELQKEYRQLQAERKKIEEKLVVLQKKQARHLKYVARKARCETPSMGEISEEQPLEDIRSFFTRRSSSSSSVDLDSLSDDSMKNVGDKNAQKATIKKAQTGPYYLNIEEETAKERLKEASGIILPKPSPKDSEGIEHGPQSDDTIILSDNEIGDEGKIGDVAKEVAQRYVCVNEENTAKQQMMGDVCSTSTIKRPENGDSLEPGPKSDDIVILPDHDVENVGENIIDQNQGMIEVEKNEEESVGLERNVEGCTSTEEEEVKGSNVEDGGDDKSFL